MRIAVVSDIHGNLRALEAVLEDLERVRPDLVVQGGDVALGGPEPEAVVRRIRDLGWPSVLGNTDQLMGDDPEVRGRVGGVVAEVADLARAALSPESIAWLTSRPMAWQREHIAVVHSVPGDCWKVVPHDAADEVLVDTYSDLGTPIAVFGHIHHPFVRRLSALTVANAGSVSLALDGDARATYAVVDGGAVEHRRIAYDVERVAKDMLEAGFPKTYAEWLRRGAWPA